jgi:hypothetical protein
VEQTLVVLLVIQVFIVMAQLRKHLAPPDIIVRGAEQLHQTDAIKQILIQFIREDANVPGGIHLMKDKTQLLLAL